jgi:hypothetical protein
MCGWTDCCGGDPSGCQQPRLGDRGRDDVTADAAVADSLVVAAEAARASLALSNCVDAGVCVLPPCRCATDAAAAAIAAFVRALPGWVTACKSHGEIACDVEDAAKRELG